MVFADFRIIDPARRQSATAVCSHKVAVARPDDVHDRGQRRRNCARKIAAVGARIAQRLVCFVECLRSVERTLRSQSVESVRVPLELREIIELRGWCAPEALLDGMDARLTGAC